MNMIFRRTKSKPFIDVLILGPARSGTTLVARLVALFGYYQIGSDSAVQEDAEINESIRIRKGKKFRKKVWEHLDRAKDGQKVCLKITFQGSRRGFERFVKRNLDYGMVLLPYKNPLATALRRQYLTGRSLTKHLSNVSREQIEMTRYMSGTNPAFVIDVDLWAQNPEESVISMAKLLKQESKTLNLNEFREKVSQGYRQKYLDSTGLDEEKFFEIKVLGFYPAD